MLRQSAHCYLYCFYGLAYLQEVFNSIRSLRKADICAKVYVVAPTEYHSQLKAICNHLLPLEEDESNSGFLFKIKGIILASSFINQPFVFLDTDTIIYNGIADLFALPEWIDVAGVQDPLGNSFDAINDLAMPRSWANYKTFFPEVNTGVLYIKASNARLLEKWSSRHSELIHSNPGKLLMTVPDQPSLVQALIDIQLNVHFLPPRFNVRACYPQVFNGPIVVVHSHSSHALLASYARLDQKSLYQTFPFGIAFTTKTLFYKILYHCFLFLKAFLNSIGFS
jgi:hypothetical protein